MPEPDEATRRPRAGPPERDARRGDARVRAPPRAPLRLALPARGARARARRSWSSLLSRARRGHRPSTRRPHGVGEARPMRRRAQPCSPAGKVFYQRNTFHTEHAVHRRERAPDREPARRRVRDHAQRARGDVARARRVGPDRLRRRRAPPYLPSPADERAWRAAGSPDLEKLMRPPGEWGPKKQDVRAGRARRDADLQLQPRGRRCPRTTRCRCSRTTRASSRRSSHDAAREAAPGRPGERRPATRSSTDVMTFLRYPRTPADLRAALLRGLRHAARARRRSARSRTRAGRPATALQLADRTAAHRRSPTTRTTSRLLATGRRSPTACAGT